MEKSRTNQKNHFFLRNYILKNIFWTVLGLLLIIGANILLNKYAGEYFNEIAQKVSGNYLVTALVFFLSEIVLGIFPAELFMIIYQSKDWGEYIIIVLVLGIISSLCGLIALLAGKYLKNANFTRLLVLKNKFKTYSNLFLKYGWVIIILAATTPLPFSMVSFIAGYFKFSPATYLKIIIPVRVTRFFISAYFIKYSISFF